MAEPIEFHFDFISPYALPGLVAMERVAAKHGRTLEMHPMMLGVSVPKAMGLPPLLDTPLKGDYLLMDVPRVYEFHGIPFRPALERFLTNPLVPHRLFCWMLGQDRARAQQAARAMLAANWSEGSDVSKLENALPHAVAAGFDETDARAAPDDEAVKQDLKQRIEASIGRGIFGSPTFIVDGEMFWGSDRTHVIDRWLETGGW
ncbi:MAG: 2-hydroxychromene-2-carboxylate isomerase [Minwuia sp.]|uniref:2-hydroxychromene-2-carboxylate isomerase n=1 Tax=Minwuia sp. TaxID=2493630 RepID=UPI003A8A0350